MAFAVILQVQRQIKIILPQSPPQPPKLQETFVPAFKIIGRNLIHIRAMGQYRLDILAHQTGYFTGRGVFLADGLKRGDRKDPNLPRR